MHISLIEVLFLLKKKKKIKKKNFDAFKKQKENEGNQETPQIETNHQQHPTCS
jgi:hypothetical protein